MVKFKRTKLIPGVDRQLLVKDAIRQMPDLTRRRFIAGGARLALDPRFRRQGLLDDAIFRGMRLLGLV